MKISTATVVFLAPKWVHRMRLTPLTPPLSPHYVRVLCFGYLKEKYHDRSFWRSFVTYTCRSNIFRVDLIISNLVTIFWLSHLKLIQLRCWSIQQLWVKSRSLPAVLMRTSYSLNMYVHPIQRVFRNATPFMHLVILFASSKATKSKAQPEWPRDEPTCQLQARMHFFILLRSLILD